MLPMVKDIDFKAQSGCTPLEVVEKYGKKNTSQIIELLQEEKQRRQTLGLYQQAHFHQPVNKEKEHPNGSANEWKKENVERHLQEVERMLHEIYDLDKVILEKHEEIDKLDLLYNDKKKAINLKEEELTLKQEALKKKEKEIEELLQQHQQQMREDTNKLELREQTISEKEKKLNKLLKRQKAEASKIKGFEGASDVSLVEEKLKAVKKSLDKKKRKLIKREKELEKQEMQLKLAQKELELERKQVELTKLQSSKFSRT